MSNLAAKSRLNHRGMERLWCYCCGANRTVMERTTFLGHYRIHVDRGGAPRELGRAGPAITYKADDSWTGETVALKLIPVASVDPTAREQFEKEGRAAERLNHTNIAKVFDFGQDEDHFVYAFEYMYGETLDAWIEEHGPMPADAVLRVAAQVVSALSAASFHKLMHRAIEPSNLMIIPGPTPEGGWPFVKLVNFGLAGLRLESDGTEGKEDSSVAPQFASPEQLKDGTVDFRSETYSLGATMYFLLTGAAPSAELRRQQLRVFPKALRNLLARMLRQNPDQRPQDPGALAEMIRECLLKIERRQVLADRFGIPFMAMVPRTAERPQGRLLRRALAFGALLLTVAALAAVLLPEPIGRILHRDRGAKTIGVFVGVPETSPAAVMPPQAPNAEPDVPNHPPTTAFTNSSQNASPNAQALAPSGQTSNPELVAAATPSESSSTTSGAQSTRLEDNSSAQTNVASQPPATNQAASASTKKNIASTSKRSHVAQNSRYAQTRFRTGSMRARVVGATSDGRLIMRLPSGRTVIVTPGSEDEAVRRPHRRGLMDRDEIFAPPPRFGPDYFPYD